MKIEKNKIANLEDIKGGYYGTIEGKGKFAAYDLYVAEIADPSEDEPWECAEWCLVNSAKTEVITIARCDGYNGIDWVIDDELLALLDGDEEALETLQDTVTPFDITGELIAAAREAQTEDADEDYEGECKIWATKYYLDGTCNAPVDGFMSDDDGDAIVYDTYSEAQDAIDELDAGTYILSHGEYERPSYKIVKA